MSDEVVAKESHDEDEFDKEFNALIEGAEPEEDQEPEEVLADEVEATGDEETEAINDSSDLAARIKELESQNAELEHSLKSNTGRVSAYQKKINEYEKAEQDREDVAPVDEEDNQELSEFEEDYPDIAANVRAMMQKNDEAWQKKFDSRFQGVEAAEEEKYNASQVEALSQEFPEWSETEQSEDFNKWVSEQPSAIGAMLSSRDAKDHSYLIRSFNNQKSSSADSIVAKREKKLAANVAVPNKNISKPKSAPDDFEAAFDYYATR